MMMKKLRQASSAPSELSPRQGRQVDRGEFAWRGVRYLAVCFAGYLLGLSAGSLADGPGFWAAAAVGLLALVLVFRSGKKSVAHSAADAVAAAVVDANARAQASASQQVTVAGGHVVNGPMPPVEAYERDVWAGQEHMMLPANARYLGTDPITSEPVFRHEGKIVTLSEFDRRARALAERHADGSAVMYDSANDDFFDPR